MVAKGQTAIEYLLLIGSVMLFVAIVAITVRGMLTPAGEISGERAAEIQTKKGDYGQTPTAIIYSCTPGDVCGTRTYPENTNCPPGETLVDGCTPSCPRLCNMEGICGDCNSVPTCTPFCSVATAAPTCSLAASKNTAPEPFSTKITASFSGLPSGAISSAKISCFSGDGDVPDSIDEAAGTATKYCNYIANGNPDSFTVTASAGTTGCTPITVTDSLPSTCNFYACDLTSANRQFYDIVVEPHSSGSPEEIHVFSDSRSCSGGDPCRNTDTRCRVKASSSGSGICAVVNDEWESSDWNWNQNYITTGVREYAGGEQMLLVTLQQCLLPSERIHVKFDFSAEKYIYDMDNNNLVHTHEHDFQLWNTCTGNVGRTRRFYITDAVQSNRPPEWLQQADIPAIHQGQAITPVNYYPLVSDDHDADAAMSYMLAQSAPEVINCRISSGQVECDPAAQNGTNKITIRATDSGGLWEEMSFNVYVGPNLNLPEVIFYRRDNFIKLHYLAVDPGYNPVSQMGQFAYSISTAPDPSLANCFINHYDNSPEPIGGHGWVFICNRAAVGRQGVTSATIRMVNPAGTVSYESARIVIIN